jgi:hypothetical protein
MYTAFFDELEKIAEEEKKKPSTSWRLAKIIGSGAAGFGVGTAAGLGLGHAADLVSRKATGHKLPKSLIYGASPLLGAAGGIAYSMHKAREQEAIRRALSDQTEPGAG